MDFKFNSRLDFQLKAIESVNKIFQGQEFIKQENYIKEYGIIENRLNLDENEILNNLKSIQNENNLKETENLKSLDFTIEMETGTGKTYVYLRTILELNKNYGFTKFIIIVPSVAIREGVIKTLQQTKKHFKEIYNNLIFNFYNYNSKNITSIKNFSQSRDIEIMIMTIDSFNKDTNIIEKELDKLQGRKPIDLIKKTKPILILDEPQNMESEKSKDALTKLNSLFNLRYSATHKEHYNLIYRLTPLDAYNKNLVKKIEVLSVIDENINDCYIKLIEITSNNSGIKAKIEIITKSTTGEYKKERINCKRDDELYKKTNNSVYENLYIKEINKGDEFINLSNETKIEVGQDTKKDKEIIFREQIHQTIKEHFNIYIELK
jgi:type III restriction enzyme